MTLYVVELAPAAEVDIHDAFIWYQTKNAGVADAFRSEVFETIDRIAITPLGKAADEEGNRRRVLRRFPYSVVYEVKNVSVIVLAVAHHRRQPGYWQV